MIDHLNNELDHNRNFTNAIAKYTNYKSVYIDESIPVCIPILDCLKHEVFTDLYNKNDQIYKSLFDNVHTLNGLIYNIKKVCKEYYRYGYEDIESDGVIHHGFKKMRGDIFEIFAECFFKINNNNNSIGVSNYTPVEGISDYGVDAYGVGIDNHPCTIQVKFRENVKALLIEKDIKQFPLQSIKKYGVDDNTSTNMIIFTCCAGVHHITQNEVYLGLLRTINKQFIETIVDGNQLFWENIQILINNTIREKYGE